MRKTLLSSVALSALSLAVATAWAAELGSLTVYSVVGEPLSAQLTVKDVKASDAPKVRLAPASLYERVGKKAVVPVSDLSIKLKSKNPYVLTVETKKAVESAEFPLIVEMTAGSQRSAKLYNVALRAAVQKTEVPQVKTPSAAKPAVQVPAVNKPQGGNVAAQVPSASGQTPVASVAKNNVSAPANEAPRVMQPIYKPTQEPKYVPPVTEPKVEKAPAEVQKPAESLYPNSVDVTKKFTVEPGMTMWSIAKLFKDNYPQATMDQVLVAFVRDNPKSFEKGRVNSVRVGSTLRAPKRSTVESIPVDHAWALVRVNSNADARKAPGAKALRTAQAKMKASNPALYREVQARLAQEKKAQAERRAKELEKQRAAELKAQEEALAAKKAQEEAAAKQEAAQAAQANEKAADNDPLAATIEATSRGQEVDKTTSADAGNSGAAQSSQATPDTGDATLVVKEEPKEEGGLSGMLIALIVALVAAVGAAGVFLTQRNRRRRQEEEDALRTVRFMKAPATSDEQLQGAADLVQNRMEADRAAQRGFVLESETQPQTVQDTTEPSVEPVKETPVENQGKIEPKFEVHSESEISTPASGFNVATAYAADRPSTEDAQSDAPVSALIIKARNYAGVGGYDQALKTLSNALPLADAAQKAEIEHLMEQVKKQKAGL